jgi:hypothetical protein
MSVLNKKMRPVGPVGKNGSRTPIQQIPQPSPIQLPVEPARPAVSEESLVRDALARISQTPGLPQPAPQPPLAAPVAPNPTQPQPGVRLGAPLAAKGQAWAARLGPQPFAKRRGK